MNQQRSRRFRAAQDAEEKEREEQRLREEFAKQGIKVPKADRSDVFDSNTITPGTPFMHRLSLALQYYVHMRLNADPGWRHVKVILSDANSPGEGEHKIMAYIREQRGAAGHDPNTRHCVYGLDADLIMLALSTHEPRFAILREVVFMPAGPDKGPSSNMMMPTHMTARNNPSAPVPVEAPAKQEVAKKPYQFLLVGILREYLQRDLHAPTPFPFDKERVFDDFVFLCFFVGNDFLPHMPTLEIREGAIELLIHTYRQLLPAMGYLCEGPKVHLDRVERFILQVGQCEDAIFQRRMRMLQRQKERRKAEKMSKWGTRAPAAEVATRAQAIASHMGKSARLGAALKAPSIPFNLAPARPMEMAGGAAGGPPGSGAATPAGEAGAASNKSAAQLLKERILAGAKRPASAAGSGAAPAANAAAAPAAAVPAAAADSEGEDAQATKKLRSGSGSPVPTAVAGADGATARQVSDGIRDMEVGSQEPAATIPGLAGVAVTAPTADVETGSNGAAVAALNGHAGQEAAFWAALGGAAGAAAGEGAAAEDGAGPEAMEEGGGAPVEGDGGAEGGEEVDDDEVEPVVEDDDEPPPELVEPDIDPEVAAKNAEAVEAYKAKLKEQGREAADRFDDMVDHEEKIRLGEAGWKERYYEVIVVVWEKFGVPAGAKQEAIISDLVKAYVEGLCWVMRYYYDGVASWTWFYPFHYAPFASDMHGIGSLSIEFDLGEPFKPFDQLMGVLPAASAHALPKAYQRLFTACDSPILDFYPKHFAVDMNGKRFAWQGVALLPFIDEGRLLKATRELEHTLTEEERYRNSRRLELMYIAGSHALAPEVYELAEAVADKPDRDDAARLAAMRELDVEASEGMAGFIAPPAGEPCPAVVPAPFESLGDDITSNSVVCCVYKLPQHTPHLTHLLPGAVEEDPVVNDQDVPEQKPLWHEDTRGRGRGGGGGPPPPAMLGAAAHRMIHHGIGGGRGGGAPGYPGAGVMQPGLRPQGGGYAVAQQQAGYVAVQYGGGAPQLYAAGQQYMAAAAPQPYGQHSQQHVPFGQGRGFQQPAQPQQQFGGYQYPQQAQQQQVVYQQAAPQRVKFGRGAGFAPQQQYQAAQQYQQVGALSAGALVFVPGQQFAQPMPGAVYVAAPNAQAGYYVAAPQQPQQQVQYGYAPQQAQQQQQAAPSFGQGNRFAALQRPARRDPRGGR
ncbi:hypothetical protein N2152v2_006125 [Parachlorella kessleri]